MYFEVSSLVMVGPSVSLMRRSHLTFMLPSKPGQQQAHRIAVRGAHALAVLVERDHRVVERLLDRERCGSCRRRRHPRPAATSPCGSMPASSSSTESFTPVHSEHDSRPWIAWTLTARRLLREQSAAVAGAFDEGDARGHRIAREVVEGEHQRPLDEAVNQQPVRIRIDVGNAAVACARSAGRSA